VLVPFDTLKIKAGWAAGLGVEAHLGGPWTGKLEVLHLDFGTFQSTAVNDQSTPVLFVDYNQRITDNIVRFGLNYKFDPDARYAPATNATAAVTSEALYRPRMNYKTPVEAVWTWTGFYVGVNVGYGWGRSQSDVLFSDAGMGIPLFATGASSKFQTVIGGAQSGYNVQSGNWLLGLETDIQATNARTIRTDVCPGANCNAATTGLDVSVQYRHRLDWFGTLRGRLGAIVTPNTLAFVTGGLALAGISHVGTISGSSSAVTPVFDDAGNPVLDDNGNPITTTTVTPASTSFLSRTMKLGWAAGAGIEARLAGNWTGKIEYLHMDFGSDSIDAANPMNDTPIALRLNSRVTQDVVRVGLNYKFDPNAPAPTYQVPASAR
jgi:opacity protein-like surface antigen